MLAALCTIVFVFERPRQMRYSRVMFIGHFALGFAAKRATPRVSLVALFAAAQLADILWPFFLLAGWEQVRPAPGNNPFLLLDFVSYPLSHSLLMLVIWGVALGFIYQKATGAASSAFIVLAALVVSHWVLDVATHRPDMPLYPGGPKFGLGLWNYPTATLLIEGAMFVVGLSVYLRATRARDRVGRWATWTLVALLVIAYGASLAGGAPPPENAIALGAIAGAAVIIAISGWADRHRQPA
ncbi:MAG TPA: metal-dependent hydrolase [Vicinamibacterales bacterium]